MPPRIVRGAAAPAETPATRSAPKRRSITPASAARELGSAEMSALRASVIKRYGHDMLRRGTDVAWAPRIPTGIFTLDYSLLGGVPQSRFTMAHGKKHSGKTTFSLRALAHAQLYLPDTESVLVDVEGTYDAVWGEKQGIDNDTLTTVQPEYGEQAVDVICGLIETDSVGLIVLDSIAAMVPMKETENSAEDSLVGAQARLLTSFMRKANAAMIKERRRGHAVTIILINQERTKIGGFSPTGEPLSLPGGQAIGFFSSVELKFKNKENKDKKGEDGFETLSVNEHAFVIEKNKCNAGMRSGEFRMLRRDDPELGLTEGDIDDAATMLAFSKRIGWYTGGGRAWTLSFGDFSHKFDGGVDAAVRWLYENRDVYWQLRCHLIADNAAKQGQATDFVNHILGE